MYNTIYPTNINYHKYNQYQQGNGAKNYGAQNKSDAQSQVTSQNQNTNSFPNGTKVAIDYSKQINISQVLTDFRSTILAINAPKEVEDEVSIYLNLVEKESKKENPSKEIIVSNLRNASKISDNFIASALGKQSNVVENWINTLFLQNINLKSDPNEINPDFQLQFPQKAQARIDEAKQKEKEQQVIANEQIVTSTDNIQKNDISTSAAVAKNNIESAQAVEEKPIASKAEKTQGAEIQVQPQLKPQTTNKKVEVQSSLELTDKSQAAIEQEQKEVREAPKKLTPFSPNSQNDIQAKELLSQAKKAPTDSKGSADKINLLNEALGILAQDNNANPNIKAAIHLERGKVFDDYDYVDYALRDYFEASKANEPNLKANAFYKSGTIYDEFNKFSPALSNYLSSVAYSSEADNIPAQAKVLTRISSLYTRKYDKENAKEYSSLAIDSANNTNNPEIIANTYSTLAQNYQHLGENELALDSYKNAIKNYFQKDNETSEQVAHNYEQAAIVMRRLGNFAKADKLQQKALLYYQKSQQEQIPRVKLS